MEEMSQTIHFYHTTGSLLLGVLQFTALSQIANAHSDIGQARRLEKQKKCQSQTYFTFICLPKLLNEVSVTDSLTICHLFKIFKPQQQRAISKNLTMMLYEQVMCYIAGVTQTDTAKPIWFSHQFFMYFNI